MDSPETPQADHDHEVSGESFLVQYKPLLIILGLLLLSTLALAWNDLEAGQPDWGSIMQNFMAGFFLVFAGLKLLDIAGFARSYGMYDLLASRVPAYGYVYPFLELALGLAYLTRFMPFETNIATFVLMTFGAVGVGNSLLKKREFQCACMGALIKVPLSKIALLEDVVMAVMAAVMIAAYVSAGYLAA